MNKFFIFISISLFFIGCERGSFIKKVESKNSFDVTVTKLQKIIKSKKLTLFEVIDHQKNAKSVNLKMLPQKVVIFGNPNMGTALMKCNPSIALDLPLRISIDKDYAGVVTLRYTNPEYWSLKHNVKDKQCLNILNKASIALFNITKKVSEK